MIQNMNKGKGERTTGPVSVKLGYHLAGLPRAY